MRKRKAEPIAAELIVATGTVRVPAEIVPSNAAEFKNAITRLVEQKVAEALSGDGAVFEPWFQQRTVSDEIRNRQTVQERQKWRLYYDEWGCVVCNKRKHTHQSNGMCARCYRKIHERLTRILRRNAPPETNPDFGFKDTVRLAREALAPSVKALSAKNAKNRDSE